MGGPNSNAAPAAKLDEMFGSPLCDQPLWVYAT